MSDQFPKNRGGGWSGQGRTDARTIADVGVPDDLAWLRRRRPGVEARNKGGHLVVKVEQPPVLLGRFLSLGVESGSTVLRGSRTARGEFAQATPSDASALFFDQLIPRGNGTAYTTRSASYLGDAASVFSSINERWAIDSYIVRPGAANVVRPPIEFIGPVSGLGVNDSQRGADVLNTTGARFDGAYEHATCYPSIDPGGQHIVEVMFDNGTTQRRVTAASVPDQIIFPISFNRVGPGAFLGLAGSFIWRGTAPGWYDQTEVPGLFFFATTDNGATWFTFDSPAFIAHEQEQYEAVANDGPIDVVRYNQSMNDTNGTIMPLSATKALVGFTLGSPDETAPGSGVRYENFRVRIGVADLVARTVTLLTTLYDPPFTTTNLITNRNNAFPRSPVLFVAPGGGVLVFFNDVAYPANWTALPQILFTFDGEPLQVLGNSPIETGRAGLPMTVSRTKLLMVAYIGTEHVLLESVDRGLTWEQRAIVSTIATEAAPGAQPTRAGPRSFNNVVALQIDGAAARATPGAPWLTDDRVTQPSPT